MKKFIATLLCGIFLTACSSTAEDIAINVLNTKQEASEAIQNLASEAMEIKDDVGMKLEQIQQAAESVSEAMEAINKAKEDISAVTSGSEEEQEENNNDDDESNNSSETE